MFHEFHEIEQNMSFFDVKNLWINLVDINVKAFQSLKLLEL